MLLGSWGPFIFIVSPLRVFTFKDAQKEAGGRWDTHETINTKPVPVFLGPDLRSITLTVSLAMKLGTLPDLEYEALARAAESGQHYPLIIIGDVINTRDYYLESISQSSSDFDPLTAASTFIEVILNFKEYN